MSSRALVIACSLALGASFVAPAAAHAQSSRPRHGAAERRRFDRYVSEAQAAYAAGDSAGAVAALERAYALRAEPMLLFNLARAYELGGDSASAIEQYDRFIATTPDRDLADQARGLRDAAADRLAAQHAEARPTSATPAPAPRPAPTPHPAPAPRGRAFGPAPIALLAGAGAALITGAVLGGLALGASSGFAQTSDPGERASLQDRANGFAGGADVGLGLGVGLAIVGVVVYFAQPPAR